MKIKCVYEISDGSRTKLFTFFWCFNTKSLDRYIQAINVLPRDLLLAKNDQIVLFNIIAKNISKIIFDVQLVWNLPRDINGDFKAYNPLCFPVML